MPKERFTKEQQDAMDKAGDQFLLDGMDSAYDMYFEYCNNFDESVYQQGVKDGMRMMFALLGNPEYLRLIASKEKIKELSK